MSDETPIEAPARAPGEPEAAPSPYKNLWVPLIVVPAGIVMVLLCIFLFFGAIGGHETSLEQNLQLVVSGGANQRKQAAFNLGVQIAENQRAQLEGREAPWQLGADFLPELRRAWESVSEEDHEIRLALACLQAQHGDEQGVPNLISMLDIDQAQDPQGQLRFKALAQLSALGDERGLPSLVASLGDPDEGLRRLAAIGLQKQSGPVALEALRGALGDESLVVRANAALSLSILGDPAGAPVLIELLSPQTYADERERHERRFSRGELVTSSRASAVRALGALRRPEDREILLEMAASEPDLAVREAAMLALEGWSEDVE